MTAHPPSFPRARQLEPTGTLVKPRVPDPLNSAIVERDHYRRLYRSELDKARREAIERKELVKVHLANLAARLATPETDEAAYREAEIACENSYSDLVVGIEDCFCVDGETMARALS